MQTKVEDAISFDFT